MKEHKKRTEQSYILLLYYWKIIFNLQLNDHVCCSPQKRCRDQKALFNIRKKRKDTICIDLNYRFNFDIGLICTFQSCWAYRSLYMICYMQKVKIKWNAIDWPRSRVQLLGPCPAGSGRGESMNLFRFGSPIRCQYQMGQISLISRLFLSFWQITRNVQLIAGFLSGLSVPLSNLWQSSFVLNVLQLNFLILIPLQFW